MLPQQLSWNTIWNIYYDCDNIYKTWIKNINMVILVLKIYSSNCDTTKKHGEYLKIE